MSPDIVPNNSDKLPPENRDRDRDRERDRDKDNNKSLLLFEELGFGSISPIILEDIKLLEKEYTETWVIEALKEANAAGVRNLKYVIGILKNWKAKGFKAEKPQNKQQTKYSKTSGFNNFEPREYDYDSLEKKLLGWED